MYEDLRAIVEELAGAVSEAIGSCGLTPAHSSDTGRVIGFLDAPTLNPIGARLTGEGGISFRLYLVAPGQDREQILALYEALPVVLEAIPSSWTLEDAITPGAVGDSPAFIVPLTR